METVADTHSPHSLGAHTHPPKAHRSSHLDPRTLGVLIFIVSEAMLFGAFFASYFFIRVVANTGPWPPNPEFERPVFEAGINTLILLLSSGTVFYALRSIRNNNRSGLKLGLLATLILGTLFLALQIREFADVGFAIHDGGFGSTFYGLTGLHGAHVLVGLVLLVMVSIRAFRGHFSSKAHLGVELPGFYWYFVVATGIVVFTTVYVL